tara:strand:- start:370 stop:735 length:366 start_codon:yes stop_codon:yes gene_type:complete
MSKEKTYWALDLAIDLHDCDLDKFNIYDIKLFANELGELIDYGREISTEASIFGQGEDLMDGFRLVHHSFACLITGHFVKDSSRAYINIHSCQPYKPSDAIELCGDFFGTTRYACRKNMRD